jgi:hypothetical protein
MQRDGIGPSLVVELRRCIRCALETLHSCPTEYLWSTPRLQIVLISSGDSLCMSEATSSVVFTWCLGVAVAADIRLIMYYSLEELSWTA